MSLIAINPIQCLKPFNYPISINATVTNCTQINDENWSFTVQFTSNITTWNITQTLSQFEQLHIQLKQCAELESIKIPRSLSQFPRSRFNHEFGKQTIEEYLWKLLRRAYIYISSPLQSFIQLPIIMEQKTNLLSKQLSIVIRDDTILYSETNDNKYTNIQCILRASYVFDAYKISNNNNEYMISNELNEGFGSDNRQSLFRIDVVQIKRVLRYQKEYKFAIETRKGQTHAFKCKTKTQFNHWLSDIKNMIKAQDGCTPYLSKWENNGIEMDNDFDEKLDISDDELLDTLDFNIDTHGAVSVMTDFTSISEEKHSEYIDRVDIDIESCFDNNSVSHGSHGSDSVSIEQTVYTDSSDDDDDYEHRMFDEILSTHEPSIASRNIVNDSYEKEVSEVSEESKSKDIETDNETEIESITLKLQTQKLEKIRRNSAIGLQKERMLFRDRTKVIETENDNDIDTENANENEFVSEKTDIIEYGTVNRGNNFKKAMVSLEEFNLLKEQMLLWQSKANRWEDMANRFERSQQKMEMKLKEKELKYKHKIKDQQNEILTVTKLYNQSQSEIEQRVIELGQLEVSSQVAIQELIMYKNKNEMRRKNSYIDGTLFKFAGDGMNNIKFGKAPKLKYVMYVPTKRKMYYSDSQCDDAETKLVNVTYLLHRNQDESMANLPNIHRNKWIKIIGQNRIVLFVAKSEEDADRWYDTIRNSLQQYDDD